jgi:hypothetical protein
MTLTTWLTDYVFTPLRMAMREWGDIGLVISLTINMVLIGLWHGFRWNFALFGVIHAMYLSIDALSMRRRKKYYKTHRGVDRLTTWVGPVVTFHLVAIAFVFFRGDDVGSIFYFLSHLGKGIGTVSAHFSAFWDGWGRGVLVGLGGYAVLETADYIRRRDPRGEMSPLLPRWGRWSVYSCTLITVVLLVLLLLAGGQSRSPFLYAIF